MSPLSFLFPFRDDHADRSVLFNAVAYRYGKFYPDAEMCIGTNFDEPFNRSAARNNAFGASHGDVLIINDADTFCSRASLDRAIALVSDGSAPFVLPYEVYYNLNTEWTKAFLLQEDITIELPEDIPDTGYEHRLLTAESGVLVVSREAWMKTGGYDERFTGYGWEDNAFISALEQANGRGLKIPGTAYHLWHELPGDPFQHPWKEHNRSLWQTYGRHSWRTAQ